MVNEMNFTFRPAQSSDAASIIKFQLAMALETENLALDAKTCESGVQAVFADSQRGRYYVCAAEDRVVGSLLIVPEWSDWRNGTVWWIHSVYIEPEHRGQGRFSAFFSYIKELADADSAIRGLRLYVDCSNTKAQAVYRKLGMNGDHYRVFELMKTPSP